jgi:hypothetical protein
LSGGTWSKVATFGSTGFRGLAGAVTGSNVTLLAGPADANGSNSLVRFIDTGSGIPTGTTLSTATVGGTTSVYRAIALPPHN